MMNSLSKAMNTKIRTQSRERLLRTMSNRQQPEMQQQPAFKNMSNTSRRNNHGLSRQATIENQRQFESMSYQQAHHDMSGDQDMLMGHGSSSASMFD